MTPLIVAIQFLTRLPVPHRAATREDMARAMRWFPAVGLIVGATVALAAWVGGAIDAWTAALAATIAWVAVTGGLHLDGLGDIADAAGAAHRDPARLRAVLADPHAGSFAVIAIAVQLIAKLVLVHALVERGAPWPLIAVPAAARIGPLVWARMLPPLHDGLGALFGHAVRRRDLIGWAAVVAGMLPILPGLIAALALIPAWGLWLRHRIGGISGDGHGAGIEIVESGLLIALVLAVAR